MYSVSVLITELLHGSVSTVQKLSRDSFPPTDELLISQVLWFVTNLLRSVRSVAVSINYSYQINYQYQLLLFVLWSDIDIDMVSLLFDADVREEKLANPTVLCIFSMLY